MVLSDFKTKAVRGLYDYDHWEAPDGAWIQRRIGTRQIIYCASPDAPFQYFADMTAFRVFLEAPA